MPSEPKINVSFAYDRQKGQMWVVDDVAKLPSHLVKVAIAAKPLRLENVKALVYDSERDNTVCLANVTGWTYDSRLAQAAAKGLFAYAHQLALIEKRDQSELHVLAALL